MASVTVLDHIQDEFPAAGRLERLPFECYLLRGALSSASQEALARRVGTLASGAFVDRGGWTGAAAAQEHPIIVAAHSAGATRPRGNPRRATPCAFPLLVH
jgi:hypothetical protein